VSEAARNSRRFSSLLDQAIAPERIAEQARELLEPVHRYDAEHHGDLIHTLRIYFAYGGNASQAAEALFLHRNGMLYRLNRIENLLGVSLDNRDVYLALNLILRL
jgi:purine catabolism regulator